MLLETDNDRDLLSFSRLAHRVGSPVRTLMRVVAKQGIEPTLVLNDTAYFSASAAARLRAALANSNPKKATDK